MEPFLIWPSFSILFNQLLLFESFVETMFPMVDALMGFQMHMAPRVILINSVPSLPITVEASILAGCGYSVPWVGSLMHPGSVVIARTHPMYKTYVDDVNNVAAGYGPDVEDAVVACALAFNANIVVKRKFTLSNKSAVVSNDKKLAIRVAKELLTYGMVVQTPKSIRDVGVMCTAGVFRDTSLSKVRAGKATIRTSRISKLPKFLALLTSFSRVGLIHKALGDTNVLVCHPCKFVHCAGSRPILLE